MIGRLVFKKVLAAVDLGSSTAQVLDEAAAWCLAFDGALTICHVRPLLMVSGVLSTQANAKAALGQLEGNARLRDDLARRAEELGRVLGSVVEVSLDVGLAAEEIVRRATAMDAGLVVMGTAGRSGIHRLLIGSVAESVVGAATCPVLVVRESPPKGPIIAATDLTDGSFPAIERAASVAQTLGRPLIVAHALGHGPLAPSALARRDGTSSDRYISARHWIRFALGKLRVKADERILDGSPEPAIAELAAETSTSLVVVATRGRTGIARVVVGSTAASIVRSAPCSVLAVQMT